ncbi:hypothetical protein JCM6882_005050 [Rhodosporidiobolus microsporus]
MFVDVPSRGLHAYVAVNPLGPISYASSTPSSSTPPPPDGPLDPSKPVLVFLHAPTCSTASFSRQFEDPRLRAVANLVGVDARLHGRTEAAEWKGKYSIDDSADCVQAILDQLGFQYYVFGEGVLGCRTASWLAIRRPEKVLGVMLASPAFPLEEPAICANLEELGLFLCHNKTPEGDGSCPPEALEGIASYFFGSEDRQHDRKIEFKQAFEKRYGAGFSPHDTLALSSYGRRAAIPSSLLATVHCPVVVLSGGGDEIVSPRAACEEWVKAFKNAKGGAKLHVVASAPTLMSWTDYSIVNRMLAQFITMSQRS